MFPRNFSLTGAPPPTHSSRAQGVTATAVAASSYASQVVAGTNYRVKATVTAENGASIPVVIKAFAALPHTGLPLEVKEVEKA